MPQKTYLLAATLSPFFSWTSIKARTSLPCKYNVCLEKFRKPKLQRCSIEVRLHLPSRLTRLAIKGQGALKKLWNVNMCQPEQKIHPFAWHLWFGGQHLQSTLTTWFVLAVSSAAFSKCWAVSDGRSSVATYFQQQVHGKPWFLLR